MSKIRVAISDNHMSDSIDVFIIAQDDQSAIWRDWTFEPISRDDMGKQHDPSFRIPLNAIPQLILELQNLGRPSGTAYAQGQLDKMNAHLQDMRQLVFKGKQP